MNIFRNILFVLLIGILSILFITDFSKPEKQDAKAIKYYSLDKICLQGVTYWNYRFVKLAPVYNQDGSLELCTEGDN